MDQLMQASHKLAEEMYKRSAEQQAAGAQAGPGEQQAGAQHKPDDDVVDADFEEVKDK
jgi:molecular chaperone DnaK